MSEFAVSHLVAARDLPGEGPHEGTVVYARLHKLSPDLELFDWVEVAFATKGRPKKLLRLALDLYDHEQWAPRAQNELNSLCSAVGVDPVQAAPRFGRDKIEALCASLSGKDLILKVNPPPR